MAPDVVFISLLFFFSLKQACGVCGVEYGAHSTTAVAVDGGVLDPPLGQRVRAGLSVADVVSPPPRVIIIIIIIIIVV